MKKSKTTHAVVSKRFIRLFASVVIVIGMLVLIGWDSKMMFLTRFSINEVPMAPSTAYVFICLAIGLWFYLRPQKIAINRNVAIASAVIVICLSCLLVITNMAKYYSNWEHAFLTIPETQLSMKLGHMSLITALLFIISGFALLFLLSNRKIVKTFSIILTLIIFTISFILLLGYGFGAPFFYFDNFIPPAALTVLSFLLVSLGLIAASDKNTFFVKSVWKTSTSAKLLRTFLPTTIAITVIESFIVIRILPLLNIHPAIGVSLVSLIVVGVVIVVISIISKSMGKTLDSALENLSESEAKFRFIFENSMIGNSMTGIDGSLRVNESFCKIVGYTQEELRAKTWMDISHPDEIQQTSEMIQSLLDGKISQAQFEKRYIHKNGTIVFTDVSTYLQRDNNGDPLFFITSVIDITERKQAEEALKESEEQLRIITNNLPILISQIDKDLKYTYANQYYYDVAELQDSMIGKNVVDVIGKETFNRSYPNMQKALSGEQVRFENRYLNKKNNKLLIMESHFIPYVVNDQVESFFVLAMDITERKLAEEALRESEEKLSALFTSMTEIVVMHELVLNPAGKAIDYRIIDCNNAYTEATGVSKEDAIGKLASEVYQTTPPPFLEQYAKVAQGGDPHEFTTYYPPLDKHYMISVISHQIGKIATITTDISDMMQIQEMVMAKNKEMENYLYIASHDLRTPLVNIQGFSQRLKKQADSIKTLFADKRLEPEIRQQLGIITDEDIPKSLSFVLSSIEKMDTLINGLLQLSRTGRVEMNIQKIDMNALFANILQSLDFQIKEAQCEIHINPLTECYGDAALLDQLFTNIISNALKYSDSDRALEITVGAKKTYNKVVYSIRDTGKGIAQNYLNKIWDVFYRVDPRSDKDGEGLGLSLVKRIVEKHKGKVWAESEENNGSNFYIELSTRSFTEF